MKRIVSLITAFTVSLQASGLAMAATYSRIADGHPDTVTDPYLKTSNLQLDNLGRVEWVEDPVQAATGSLDDRTDIDYDEWGRQEVITHPPKFIGDTGHTTQFQYDAGDNVALVTDERGKTVGFQYDDAGQLTQTTNQELETEIIQYTDRGWVWKVTNGRGKIREYVNTDRGDLYQYKLPLGGINKEGESWSYDGNGNSTAHAYFKSGLINQSESKSYTYDAANRLTYINYGGGGMTNVTFTYDNADRQKTMVDGTGTTEWFYDLDGQVNKMISPQGTMEYDYHSATGQFWKLIEKIPGQSDIVTTYDYDDAGRVDYINKFSETTTFVFRRFASLAPSSHGWCPPRHSFAPHAAIAPSLGMAPRARRFAPKCPAPRNYADAT